MTSETNKVAQITGATRLYAIVGDPIAQVKSPEQFNTRFADRGEDAVLLPVHVSAERFAEFIAAFRHMQNFDGLVVTVPHKILAYSMVDRLSERARLTGAVNAIAKLPNGELIGDAFDGDGFRRGLDARGFSVRRKKVLIVGAGGAGSCIALSLASAAPALLDIYDVDETKARSLIHRVEQAFPHLTVSYGNPRVNGHDLAVNCTPIGMKDEARLPFSIELADERTLIAEVVMQPAETRLLREAKSRGCMVQPGIEMLKGQMDAFTDFFHAYR
jgi:shikimate dehydrogenase